jgi:hypothetical protein
VKKRAAPESSFDEESADKRGIFRLDFKQRMSWQMWSTISMDPNRARKLKLDAASSFLGSGALEKGIR